MNPKKEHNMSTFKLQLMTGMKSSECNMMLVCLPESSTRLL